MLSYHARAQWLINFPWGISATYQRPGYGLQVVAPDTPYVAAAGPNKVYFIYTQFDAETAKHVHHHRRGFGYGGIENSVTDERTFFFDPFYAKVLVFAKGMNRHNPGLKLSEHEMIWTIYNISHSRIDSCQDLYHEGCRRHTR